MREHLLQSFREIRKTTELLCNPLLIEDYVVQGMEDVSPPKWHLAHTTWFFETFILLGSLKKYPEFDPLFTYLFNSYYQGIGMPYPRPQRGLLARPSVERIYEYRSYVDKHMETLLNNEIENSELSNLVLLGLEHEQQHQELLLMDIKYNFSLQPKYPVYKLQEKLVESSTTPTLNFVPVEGGLVNIGYRGKEFCFDHELPSHTVFLTPYLLADRLVTNGEFLAFIEDGGYKKANYWLSDAWDWIKLNNIHSPLYWRFNDNDYHEFTLSGLLPLDKQAPVSHLSFFEADAFARWRNCRLPTEEEWENYASNYLNDHTNGNYLESRLFHPQAITTHKSSEKQFFGDLWEWTASAYSAYPGYKPLKGAVGEYNGKFMNNQKVLRGGSFATPEQHHRATYRNFFQPEKRWHFCGMRLALDQ